MARGQAERLMPLLQEMLAEAGIGWSDLAALGVGIGPGNFTGLRLSVAAARGLALSLSIPAVGVTSFEATALEAPRPCTVLLPAMRGQLYRQTFRADGPDAPGLIPQDAATTEALPRKDPAALATAIARIARSRRDQPGPRPAPLYLRSADAAPARDAPPMLLP